MPPFHIAITSRYNSVAQLLLDNKASDQANEATGQTALCMAVREGHRPVVQFPIDKSQMSMPRISTTRCHYCGQQEKGHFATVKLLIKNGANINIKDKSLRTPLSCAVGKGHTMVVSLLLDIEGIEKGSGIITPYCDESLLF
jgi:uncharacterized protein